MLAQYLLFFLTIASVSVLTSLATFPGVRLDLTHVDSKGGFTEAELVSRAAARARNRVASMRSARTTGTSLAARTSTIGSPIHKDVSEGEYLMDLSIGTPPVFYSAIADTGSDLIWTQCQPCVDCFTQPFPVYDPRKSSTFSHVACGNTACRELIKPRIRAPPCCSYNYTYGTGWTTGVLGTETFTFRLTKPVVSVPRISFGCSHASSDDFAGSAGLVGLGRGPLSLVSQTRAGKFSYCLTSFTDTKSRSSLYLGPMAVLNEASAKSMPFVANPAIFPSFYFIPLKGISLGKTLLPIPSDAFELSSDGSRGTIIDSGSSITTLVDTAYEIVKKAIKAVVKLPLADGGDVGLDLCYALPAKSSRPPKMPSMTFHFTGADMELASDKYMIHMSEEGLWCLQMTNTTNDDSSIFGNYQQQNMHILYDLQKGVLSFAPAQCNKV